jgi:hypothetical protein
VGIVRGAGGAVLRGIKAVPAPDGGALSYGDAAFPDCEIKERCIAAKVRHMGEISSALREATLSRCFTKNDSYVLYKT